MMASSNLPKLFEYMKIIGQLKNVERTGWVRSGVKNPESVAEHMYRMAMIAFALPSNTGLDRDKCMKIALVHDMAESMVGDLTPWCGVSKEEKNKRENAATSHISGLLSEERGKEMYSLWLEYEIQTSPEAKFVKDLDKFEMLLQAFEYEELEGKPRGLQEFYDHTKEKYTFSTDLVSGWCGMLDLHRARSERAAADSSADAGEKPPADKKLDDLYQ